MIDKMERAFFMSTIQRYSILAKNIYFGWEGNEMDLLGVRKSGYIDEVEIKLSKSDYLADFKKTHKAGRTKHEAVAAGLLPCNYFAFFMPEELAGQCEIPEYAGLYTFRIDNTGNGRISEEKRSPILHRKKIGDKTMIDIGRKMAYRYWQRS